MMTIMKIIRKIENELINDIAIIIIINNGIMSDNIFKSCLKKSSIYILVTFTKSFTISINFEIL